MIHILDLSGSGGFVNKLLEFSTTKFAASGLTELWFTRWKATVVQISPEILAQIAGKTPNLIYLEIS